MFVSLKTFAQKGSNAKQHKNDTLAEDTTRSTSHLPLPLLLAEAKRRAEPECKYAPHSKVEVPDDVSSHTTASSRAASESEGSGSTLAWQISAGVSAKLVIIRIENCGDWINTFTDLQGWAWACRVFGLPVAQVSARQRTSQYSLTTKALHLQQNGDTSARASAALLRFNTANNILGSTPPPLFRATVSTPEAEPASKSAAISKPPNDASRLISSGMTLHCVHGPLCQHGFHTSNCRYVPSKDVPQETVLPAELDCESCAHSPASPDLEVVLRGVSGFIKRQF